MSVYVGYRSCQELYEGICCIDKVISRLEDQLDEFRRMKEAGVEVHVCDACSEEGQVCLLTKDPETGEEFDFEEEETEFDEEEELVAVGNDRPPSKSSESAA